MNRYIIILKLFFLSKQTLFFFKNYIYLQKGSKNHMTSLNRSANLKYVCLRISIWNLFNLLLLNLLLRTKNTKVKVHTSSVFTIININFKKPIFSTHIFALL